MQATLAVKEMNSSSICDEMEPRMLRPTISDFLYRDIPIQGQVSEPSLFNLQAELAPFRQVFNPRTEVGQTSPVRSPAFIPQLTPLSSVKSSARYSNDSSGSPCSCKSSGCNSPSIDPEIKQLIQDQNKQLQMLRNQVEKLIQYQETLKDNSETKERSHESTQTSFGPITSPSPPQTNNCSPLSRPVPQDRTELTLTFRDLQLETIIEQPLSPQPSIVLNMQEYQNSVSDKNDDSLTESCVSVMEHVQRLLAQANTPDNGKRIFSDKRTNNHQQHGNVLENPVRKVTMQRVQELGISFIAPSVQNPQQSPVYYPRFQSKKAPQLDARKETDQSVEMERLAEKYLGKTTNHLETKMLDYSVKTSKSVEMSMSSQQYLERYGLHSHKF